MTLPDLSLPPHHQPIFARFIAACQEDERILAAFLLGSYARGAADAYSDLDLGVLTSDESFQNFISNKWGFIQKLDEPLFQEDFDHPNIALFICSNGAECELNIFSQSQVAQLPPIPVRLLLDKSALFPETLFTPPASPPQDQVENLRCLIFWFWHNLSHFITAMQRGQLWWARGQLEELRSACVSLTVLSHNFTADLDMNEPYFKVEKALPVERLSPLKETFCPLEPKAMLQSVWLIVRCYQELARPLAHLHGLEYPQSLEKIYLERLAKVQSPGSL